MDLLDGRSILVAEDEPIVGLHIADALRGEGATVVSAHNVKAALARAATADLSAARHLFPFPHRLHGHAVLDRWPDAPVLRKPAAAAQTMQAIA